MDKKGHLMPSYSLGRSIERAISRCPPKQIFPERPGDYRGMLLGAFNVAVLNGIHTVTCRLGGQSATGSVAFQPGS
jgi:hypothetical protein